MIISSRRSEPRMHNTATVVLELDPNRVRHWLVRPYVGAPVGLMAQLIRHLIAFAVYVLHHDVSEAAEEVDDFIVHRPGDPCVRRLAPKQPNKREVVAFDDQPMASHLLR